MRETDVNLQLFCVVPYEEQATKWALYLRERYFTMLGKCTHVTVVSLRKTKDAQLNTDISMIDQPDLVCTVYDSASAHGDDVDRAIAFAHACGKPVILLHPDTLKMTGLETRDSVGT